MSTLFNQNDSFIAKILLLLLTYRKGEKNVLLFYYYYYDVKSQLFAWISKFVLVVEHYTWLIS